MSSQIKIMTVVGARPNFMKAAPIIRAVRQHNQSGSEPQLRHILVHTGQHYDALMSDRFFVDLELPQPDVHLGVGSGSQAAQTAEVLKKFEDVVLADRPDVVIVVGDVNSTVACALATAKLPASAQALRPLVAHVEAGLRSFDRAMPEEINRIVTDHLADLLFVTERSGLTNLAKEGIPSGKIFFVGNTMIDSLLAMRERADLSTILEQLYLRGATAGGGAAEVQPYALLTLHRPSNVDDRQSFQGILEGIAKLSQQMQILFPVHPRTRKRIEEFGLGHYFENDAKPGAKGIRLIDPLGYVDFLCVMKNARIVLTDSGGIQEETSCLGVPCVTLRENTERPVTVEHGTNELAGTSSTGIGQAIARQISRKRQACMPELWDGNAAQRIVAALVQVITQERAKLGESVCA